VEGVLVLVIGACLATVVAVAAWLVHARSPGTVPVRGAAVPAAVVRRTASLRLAGVIAGLTAGCAAASQGALGRGPLLAGPVFGLCVLAGVAAGEISVRPAGGRTRTAAVEVRRVRDYLPRGLAAAVTAAAAVLAALVAVTTVTAGPDDLGRAGRVLLLSCQAGLQQTYGPTTPCGGGPRGRSPAPAGSWSPCRWPASASSRPVPCCPSPATRPGGLTRDGPCWRC
jgi:hypothetical protein